MNRVQPEQPPIVSPGIRPGQLPPFNKLDEYSFQGLCRDLFDAEPRVAMCEVYGTRGQTQYGVDLLARRTEGDGIEVGQCKCYEAFSAASIRQASDEFLEHWDRWSAQSIKRFILFVACDLSRTQHHDQIAAEAKRFAEVEVDYEAWSAATIRNKLRAHPDIVASYLIPTDHWREVICGISRPLALPDPGAGEVSAVVNAAVANQLDALASRFSGETANRLAELREVWREGRLEKAADGIRALKSDASLWRILQPEVRADVLRLEAILGLDRGESTARARQLIEQAQALAPSDDKHRRALCLVAYLEGGPASALELATGKDRDSLNLRAAFLAELGRTDEAHEILSYEDDQAAPNAETFRLRALLHLQQKELALARSDIQKALEIKPGWESVRIADAMVDYFSALSPVALPNRIVTWPQPVTWAEIRQDTESLRRLRSAETVFWKVSQHHTETEDKRRFQTWRLACLANDSDRQEEAQAYCREVLQPDPEHAYVIAWAMTRSYAVDLVPCQTALETVVAGGGASPLQVIALSSCYWASQRHDRAVSLLAETRPVFEDQEASALWVSWYGLSLVQAGDPAAALNIVDDFDGPEPLHYVRSVALRALGSESGSLELVDAYLKDSHAETQDPRILLELCRLRAEQQDWGYVADRAGQLVREYGTGDAVTFAAQAAYNARRFDLCLELLDDNRAAFRDGRLPAQLRRIRAQCLRELGIVTEAIVELEALSRDDPTTENLLALVQAYADRGALREVAITARRLVTSSADLAPEPSLRVARLVRWEDPQLAIFLWRRAMCQGIPDSLVAQTMFLGLQLGLNSETAALWPRIAQLGEAGGAGIQIGTLGDIASLVTQVRQLHAAANEEYQAGRVPIHVLAEHLNFPLSEPYHGVLVGREAAPDPVRDAPLLIRHGGRDLAPGFPDSAPDWRLNLDITALLLAEHLDILGQVETAFGPVRIPASTVRALIEMRDKATPQQPAHREALDQLAALAESNLLRVVELGQWSASLSADVVDELGQEVGELLAAASSNDGCVLAVLPLQKPGLTQDLAVVPAEHSKHLVNCRMVLDVLRDDGPLSQAEYDAALRNLGVEGQAAPSAERPDKGTALFCQGGTAGLLAAARLLRLVCDHFGVHIAQAQLDRVRAELSESKRLEKVAMWLDRLLARVGTGMDSGTYELIPGPLAQDSRQDPGLPPSGPQLACLLTLLDFGPESRDVVWVDDRHVNGHLLCSGARIVTVTEVLKALVACGALSPEEYFARIARLRAANARFIPIQADEILHHLSQARVANGALIETVELRGLRRYVAACLVQASMLRKPGAQDGLSHEMAETAFIAGLAAAVRSGLVGLWSEAGASQTDCEARSEWLLSSVYLEYNALHALGALPDQGHDDLYRAAWSLTELASLSMLLESDGDAGLSPRSRYLGWLSGRVLEPRFLTNPQLRASVAELMRGFILSTKAELAETTDAPSWVVEAKLQLFVDDLPEPIKDMLLLDDDFVAGIGGTVRDEICIGELKFDPDSFFAAATEAVNGRSAEIARLDSSEPMVFWPIEAPDRAGSFEVRDSNGNLAQLVDSEDMELLLESSREREAVLVRNRWWFDCPEALFAEAVAEIVSTQSPRQRLETLNTWRESSASVYHRRLHKAIGEGRIFRWPDLLPPSAEGLLRHFRLSYDMASVDEFGQALSRAGEVLFREEGLVAAIDRLSAFPIPLPKVIMDEIARLSPPERHDLIRQLVRIVGSPVSRIHLVRVLLGSEHHTAQLRRLARRVLHALLDDEGVEEFTAFQAMLRWVCDEFNQWPQANAWPAHARLGLAWAHTHRLFSIFASRRIPTSWTGQIFGEANLRILPGALELQPEYRYDVCHPARVSHAALAISGIDYAVGEHIDGLLNGTLRITLVDRVFRDSGGIRVPDPGLLRDPLQVGNSLGSFLGADTYERCRDILEGSRDEGSSREALRGALANAISALKEDGKQPWAWALLRGVLGDLPPWEGLRSELSSLVLTTDFVRLFENDPNTGLVALLVAAPQAIHLGDKAVTAHLGVQLTQLATLLGAPEMDPARPGRSDGDQRPSPELLCSALMECSLSLALTHSSSEGAAGEFARLLSQQVEAWHTMMPLARKVVEALWRQLPLAWARPFSSLLVRLRAG